MTTRDAGYDFRAQFYEIEHDTRLDHAFLTRVLSRGCRSLLEIPSGAGRNLEILVGSGADVTMADIEPAMIKRVTQLINERGLGNRVQCACADMRELSFQRHFDSVIVPRDGLNLISPSDLPNTIRALVNHVEPNGFLYLDLLSSGKSVTEVPPEISSGPKLDWIRTAQSGLGVSRWSSETRAHDRITRSFNYRIEQDSDCRWSQAEITLWLHEPAVIKALLASSGLSAAAFYGSYSLLPFDAAAERLIILAARAAYLLPLSAEGEPRA